MDKGSESSRENSPLGSRKQADQVIHMARPRKDANKKQFESLVAMQCTLEEIAAYFDNMLGGCSEDTVERWCKREYGKGFAEVFALKRGVGKISLRRAGFEMAKKIPSVHIFYAKNYLGMTDQQSISLSNDGSELQLIQLPDNGRDDDE